MYAQDAQVGVYGANTTNAESEYYENEKDGTQHTKNEKKRKKGINRINRIETEASNL